MSRCTDEKGDKHEVKQENLQTEMSSGSYMYCLLHHMTCHWSQVKF